MIVMFGFSWGTALKLHVAAEVDFIWGAACLTLTSSCAAVRGKSCGYWSQWGKLKGTVKSRNIRVERLIQKEINRESTISTNPWFSEHLPCKMLNCNWVVVFFHGSMHIYTESIPWFCSWRSSPGLGPFAEEHAQSIAEKLQQER